MIFFLQNQHTVHLFNFLIAIMTKQNFHLKGVFALVREVLIGILENMYKNALISILKLLRSNHLSITGMGIGSSVFGANRSFFAQK